MSHGKLSSLLTTSYPLYKVILGPLWHYINIQALILISNPFTPIPPFVELDRPTCKIIINVSLRALNYNLLNHTILKSYP